MTDRFKPDTCYFTDKPVSCTNPECQGGTHCIKYDGGIFEDQDHARDDFELKSIMALQKGGV